MKRLISILITVLLTASLIGCSGDENLEEIISYVQNDLAELGAIETELTTSLNELVSNYPTTNFDKYRDLSTKTMNLAAQLNERATSISYSIKGEELKKVHDIYIEYTTLCLSAFSMFKSAIETDDTALLDTAGSKFDEADKIAQKYLDDSEELTKKYGINLKNIK